MQDVMFDVEIIAAVTVNEKMPENDETVNIEDSACTSNTSHSKRLKAVESAFQYFRQQGALVMNLLFVRHLRDEAAKRRG
ncbi:hypothetical protein TNCV_1093271 [Trichonephila clavipes]|nr:hypothetical protein TNCV_1093271 [Trichonephila clavipes]